MSPNEQEKSPSGLMSLSGTKQSATVDNDSCQSIFEHMPNGLAYCKLLFEDGQPRDFIYLYTNPAFEALTGLRNACRKRVTEVIPGICETDPQLFEIFSRIAQGGAPEKFEAYVNALAMWFSVSVYSPRHEHFVAVFDVITERKLAEEALRDSEERYLDVFDNTSDLIQFVSPDGSFIYTNRTWRETLGYTEQEVESLNLLDVLHPDSRVCCQDRFRRLLNGEPLTYITFKFLTKSGETVHLAGDCGSIIKEGETIWTRGIFKNISDTVEAEVALKVSEARYQALYENAPDIYITINRAGEILSVNRTGASMLGYDVGELIGESASKVIHPEDQRAVFACVEKQFADPHPDQGIEYRKIRKDGSIFWAHQRVTLEPDTNEPRLLVVCRDVTEKRNLEEQLAHQATHDSLTNLINRREFERRLQRILSSAPEPGDEHVLCFLDLDQFKIINDTCGHIAGDELLRQIAALLQVQMRSRDTLARVGGDEFAVLMEYCSMDRAVRLAEKIRVTIQDFQFYWRSQQFSIGVSIGIVPVQAGLNITDTITFADVACYTAKKEGGNCIQVYRPIDPFISG
jgi:diguanylate cyclase (GGDEF)-like protein/PAS domain S-box-containing protein